MTGVFLTLYLSIKTSICIKTQDKEYWEEARRQNQHQHLKQTDHKPIRKKIIGYLSKKDRQSVEI